MYGGEDEKKEPTQGRASDINPIWLRLRVPRGEAGQHVARNHAIDDGGAEAAASKGMGEPSVVELESTG